MKTVSIPGGPQELTAEWLTDALRSGGVIGQSAVTSFETENIGEGTGFIGQVARVRLQYDAPELGAPKALVAKFPGASPAGREVGNLFDFYRREIKFYENVAQEVELPTPRRYYSAMAPEHEEYILLLEDLAPARCGDQVAGCTPEEADLATRSIAKFHATWWNHPRLEELAEWMPIVDAPVHRSAEQSYAEAWGPFIETFGSGLSRQMREIAERVGKNVVPLLSAFANRPHTIIHGDYRLDNLFFSEDPERPLAVADWQISSRGRGVFDMAYLLCGGLEPEPRQQHERRLMQMYHDILVEHGVQGYGFDQCWNEYRIASLYVLVYVVISLGTLDFANERGLALFHAWLRRSTGAIEALDAGELLPR